MLRLICIDEMHLIVEDGISYNEDYQRFHVFLKEKPDITILVMSATMTKNYLKHFQDSTGR